MAFLASFLQYFIKFVVFVILAVAGVSCRKKMEDEQGCKIRSKRRNQSFGGTESVKKYGVNELRRMYLEFFESKGHLVMNSFSLVPHNDNSLLLINAGMAPLKALFYRTGDSTEKKSDNLPEVYPYRRY